MVSRRVGDMDSPAVWVEDDFLGSDLCIVQLSNQANPHWLFQGNRIITCGLLHLN